MPSIKHSARRALQLLIAGSIIGLGWSCTDTFEPTEVSDVPGNVIVEPLGVRRIKVTWDPVASASSYTIERRQDLSGEFMPIGDVSNPPYFDTDVEPETFYGYRVRATGRLGGLSSASAVVGARTPPEPAVEARARYVEGSGFEDPDGFLLRASGLTESTIQITNPNAFFRTGPLLPGAYTVTLDDVAPGCSVVDGNSRTVTVTDQGINTVAQIVFEVVCRDPTKASLLVHATTQGDTTDADGFEVRVTSTNPVVSITEQIVSTGSTVATTRDPRLLNLAPGVYEVSLNDIAADICEIDGTATRNVTLEATQVDTVFYTVTCTRTPDTTLPYIIRNEWVPQSAAVGDRSTLVLSYDGTQRPSERMLDFQAQINFDTTKLSLDEVLHPPGFTATANTNVPGEYRFSVFRSTAQPGVDTLTLARAIFTVRTGAGTTTRTLTPISRLHIAPDGGVPVARDSIRIIEDTLAILDATPNQPPVAEAGGPYTGTVGTAISLSAAGSSDPDGSITNYSWTFGDGATGSGRDVTHTYTTAGTYQAKVTITDNRGMQRMDSATVTITGGGSSNQAPTARISGPATAIVNTAVVFSGSQSTDPNAGDVLTYNWNFGDGTSATTATATKTFATAGTFKVKLTVTDQGGLSDADSISVVVSNATGGNIPPIAQVGGPTTAQTGAQLLYTSEGSADPDGRIVTYLWTFGDGTTGGGALRPKVFSTVGTFQVKLTVTDDGGATASDSMMVVVTEGPNRLPSAEANGPYSAMLGTPIAFSANGSTDPDGTIVEYRWDFADGNSGTSVTTNHVYARTGSYLARVTVTDNRGGTAFDTARVTITNTIANNRAPLAEANGPYFATAGLPVALTAIGSDDPDGSIVNYTWHLGDATTLTGFNTLKTYAQPGTYKIALVVTDDLGAFGTDTSTVFVSGGSQVNLPPVAEANGPYQVRAGLPIGFTANGTFDPDGSIASYQWDFGDGSTGTGASPTKTYMEAGTFAVILTVTDDRGATATDVTAVTVIAGNPPVAEANGPYTGTTGTPVSFSSAGSADADGTIAEYAWSFGDGATASGATPAHVYENPGSYRVRLIVTDNLGLTGQDSATVTITGDPLNPPPVADANGPYSGVVGTPVTFSSAGSRDPNGTIVSYQWTFGDGGTDTGESPSHTFDAPGSYWAKLTVTDNGGASHSDSSLVTITVNTPPVAQANGPYNGTAGQSIAFSASGSSDANGTITTYAWEFGDGATANGANPTHSYTSAGSYLARLTVTDNHGASATDSAAVTISAPPVNQPPIAEAGGPYDGNVGAAVSLTGSGSDADGSIAAYGWDLNNDGAFTDAATAATSFNCVTAGSFTVRLRVTDNGGLTATDSAFVTCVSAPVAAGTVRARWVNASGTPVTSVAAGSSVFLEIDVQMAEGSDINPVAGHVLYNNAALDAIDVTELACPAGGSCPSASPVPLGNVDRLTSQVGNPDREPNRADFSNFHTSTQRAVGIQGIARIEFRALAAGNANISLTITAAENFDQQLITLAVAAPPALTVE